MGGTHYDNLGFFYLILDHLSIKILMLETILLNHYGILASAIIDINCDNQLS